MPRCAVLGSPIAHSLSPVMHRTAYAGLGLQGWTYDAYDITESSLPGFLDGLDDTWRGLSLTMPLKRTVLGLVDEVSVVASDVGAVNTVLLDGGRRRGDNTDVPGMVAALRERGITRAPSVRILGAGATAASAVAAVRSLGAGTIELRIRDRDRGRATYDLGVRLGLEVRMADVHDPLEQVDLLVSTVPASFFAAGSERWLRSSRAVFDVIYDPWPTPLTLAAGEAHLPCATGLDLLAHQAEQQVALMTGRDVTAESLRAAAAAALGSVDDHTVR